MRARPYALALAVLLCRSNDGGDDGELGRGALGAIFVFAHLEGRFGHQTMKLRMEIKDGRIPTE